MSNFLSPQDVTIILQETRNGNRQAIDKLFPLLYKELQKGAHHLRKQFFNLDTFNTTAVVHEAYLKIMQATNTSIENRAHFFHLASVVMRQILINASLAKRAKKRGDNPVIADIADYENNIELSSKTAEELLLLNDALKKLEIQDERQAQIVECRFFGGMSIEETAIALNISPSTVKRSWNLARAWLYTELSEQ